MYKTAILHMYACAGLGWTLANYYSSFDSYYYICILLGYYVL